MIEMELLGVQVEIPSNSPMLLLKEVSGAGRVLPIVIDGPEAQAIYRGIEGIRMARPLTHDLILALLEEIGAKISKIVITDLRERTFFAEIQLDLNGESHVVSSRPSDAIALAVRRDIPIYAQQAVLAAAGQIIETALDDSDDFEVEAEEVAPDELLDEFKEFLEDLNPDDFS
ncbi:MAG: bifunctional nuclease family protein [Actinomycetota bacterium]|nr:bifunctional nuclease family protein [Actinomycetota bacterium]MDG2120723.1 bifunctional nuclease family protein [Actinomycetota bacterium]